MSILTRLVYSLEVKLNIFLQVLELEHPMQEPEMQVSALIETSSAKIKTRNRVAIGRLIDTLKFMGLVGHFFQRRPVWGCCIMGSPDYGSMVLFGWRVQSDSWLYSCHLLNVKSTTLYLIKYFLLIQPNYNTQPLFNRISSNLTIEWNRINRIECLE